MQDSATPRRYARMATNDLPQQETLRLWHCPECGYANVGKGSCAGCHKRAPRHVRVNTKEYLKTHSESPPQH